MLHKKNNYVRCFEYALEADPFHDLTAMIHTEKKPSGKHSRQYNAPECNEVVIIMRGGEI